MLAPGQRSSLAERLSEHPDNRGDFPKALHPLNDNRGRNRSSHRPIASEYSRLGLAKRGATQHLRLGCPSMHHLNCPRFRCLSISSFRLPQPMQHRWYQPTDQARQIWDFQSALTLANWDCETNCQFLIPIPVRCGVGVLARDEPCDRFMFGTGPRHVALEKMAMSVFNLSYKCGTN